MNSDEMTPLERTLTTLGHKEPDRVPLFLLVTMHGAKELNLSIETMAFGGDVIYYNDGPPNSGRPVIKSPEEIYDLKVPEISSSESLLRILKITETLSDRHGDKVPIPGVVMSPFSLPVIQMGFEGYLNLFLNDKDSFWALMEINKEFCINWANAQIEAGATAIVYFDPFSSPSIITPEQYKNSGFKIAKETIAAIKGPCVTHLASGRSLGIADLLCDTNTVAIGVSALEDLAVVKKTFKNRLTVIGNLNGIEMSHWTKEQAESAVKVAIDKAASGGGFILSDNHGEIPWQVHDETLHAISGFARKYGRY